MTIISRRKALVTIAAPALFFPSRRIAKAWKRGSFVFPSGVNLRLAASGIAQTDGSTVTTWPDSSGGGNNFSGGALLWLSNGAPYVELAASSYVNGSFSINKQSASFLIVLQFQTAGTPAPLFSAGSATVVLKNDTVLKMLGSGDTTFNPSTGRIAILVTLGPAGVKVYLDGGSNVQSLPAYSAGTVTGLTIGGAGALANIYDFIGWNRELTSAEALALLNAWAPTVYGTGADARTPTGRAFFSGDSITQGVGATKGRSYPFYMAVSSSWLWYDYGISGLTWGSLAVVPSAFANSTNWLMPFGGTNDTTLVGSQNGLASYCNAAIAAGITKPHIVLFTLSTINLNASGDRNAYNTWLRANYTTYAGWLVDLQVDPDIGSTLGGVENNPVNWLDGTHYNDAGYVKFAALIRSTVSGLPF